MYLVLDCIKLISYNAKVSMHILEKYRRDTFPRAVAFRLLLGSPGSNWCFFFTPELVSYSAPRELHRRAVVFNL